METKTKTKIPAAIEEHAVILDYLSLGYETLDMLKFKGKAIACLLVLTIYLLELVLKRS